MQISSSGTWQNDFGKIPHLESQKEVFQLIGQYSESKARNVVKCKRKNAGNKDDSKSKPIERIQKSGIEIWLVL